MNRYFIEVAYNGKQYAGFQIQKNAITIQQEIEEAFKTFFRESITLTGSSRTDAGVHALQNFFHFDTGKIIDSSALYNLNAILPGSIVIKQLIPVRPNAHCRFDALTREYKYFIYQQKDPFLENTAFYYPYKIRKELLDEAAEIVKRHTNFASFSKRGTQVKTFECTIYKSIWNIEGACLVYTVEANRFLRGMVRGLVATMLQVGTGKITTGTFDRIIQTRDTAKANFAVPGRGLFLMKVNYPEGYFSPLENKV